MPMPFGQQKVGTHFLVRGLMRILIVSTSADHLGDTQRKTGVSLESFVSGYYTSLEAGFDVTVCSPLGGAVPVAPDEGNQHCPDLVERFRADQAARDDLSDTLSLSEVCPDDFSGIFYPDGAGALFDLIDDAKSQNLIAQLHSRGLPCAFVGYGTAALLRVRDAKGGCVAAGRRVLIPTVDEDDALGLPGRSLSLRQEFEARGAQIDGGETVAAVEDENLITGKNLCSSTAVAAMLVAALRAISD